MRNNPPYINPNNISRRKRNVEVRQQLSPQPTIGFGHVILPSDVDREEYINFVFKSGKCMVLDHYGGVFHNVLIPKNLIDILIHPQEYTQLGSLVGWMRVEQMNAYAITNIYFDGKEMNVSSEKRSVQKKGESSNIIITESTKISPSRIVSVRGNNEGAIDGGHQIVTQGSNGDSTQIVQDLEGQMFFRADKSIDLSFLQNLTLRLGEQDVYIKINKDGIVLQHPSLIQLGTESIEPSLLGQKTVDWLNSLIDAIKAITVTTSNGPSGTPINNPIFEELSAQLDSLKSELVKTQ